MERARESLSAMIGEKAEEWWQKNRHRPRAEFWPDFEAKHPMTLAVLGCASETDKARLLTDTDNALAGLLDFEDNVFEGDPPRDVEAPKVRNKRLTYQAVTWYWARWAPLAAWLVLCGARRVEWTSPQGTFVLSSTRAEDNKRVKAGPDFAAA